MSIFTIKNIEDFNDLIYAKNKTIIIKFSTKWCGPCKTMIPIFHDCAKQQELVKSMIFAEVDIESVEEIANMCNITSIPTIKSFKNGKVIDEFFGVSKEKLLTMINNNI